MEQNRLFIIILCLIIGGFVFSFFWRKNIIFFSSGEPSNQTAASNLPLAAVAPHHDLVSNRREVFLKKLSQQSQPSTIILLSPNHFNSGQGEIITTARDWILQNGQARLSANAELADALVKNNLANEQSSAFDNEHGIKNMLGPIKRYFPDAVLVPLIFRETAKRETIEKLTDFILVNCSDCGVIASVDMSHYQPANIAEIHDIKTLRALSNLNESEIWQAEVDSNASLTFLIRWAKAKNLNNFSVFDHTNSGLLADNFEAETTTHIFGSFDAGKPAKTNDNLTFTFGGDAMFGRKIGHTFQKNKFVDLFGNLGNRSFCGTDISWINLEGPISEKNVIQDPNTPSLSFNFSKETIDALKYLKLTAVGLANNHTQNQGLAGLKITENLLANAGIDYTGQPQGAAGRTISRYAQGEIKISLIAVNALFGLPDIADFIKQEKNDGRFVIVLPHWGNEYQIKHSVDQEKLARAWLAEGADLIIGSHPHVVQDAQIINGKLVFYSLGNFVFDQGFSVETQRGLILTGAISREKLKVALMPVGSKNMKPEILKGESRKQLINRVCQNIIRYCHAGEGVIEIVR